MTLPKNITDAIDNFEGKSLDHWMHDHYGTDRAMFDAKRQLVTDARAALEAAIAAAVQPVEPPTDAEVEAWGNRMHDAMLTMDHSWGLPDDEACKPFGVHEQHAAVRRCITEAVALMRRARATGSLERLRDRVESEAQRVAESQNLERNIGMAKALGWVLGWIDEERGAGRDSCTEIDIEPGSIGAVCEDQSGQSDDGGFTIEQ